jgi:hypothetical protein
MSKPRYGSAAKSFRARPRKTKQKCIDLLGLIRPIRDFSFGCGGKK